MPVRAQRGVQVGRVFGNHPFGNGSHPNSRFIRTIPSGTTIGEARYSARASDLHGKFSYSSISEGIRERFGWSPQGRTRTFVGFVAVGWLDRVNGHRDRKRALSVHGLAAFAFGQQAAEAAPPGAVVAGVAADLVVGDAVRLGEPARVKEGVEHAAVQLTHARLSAISG